MQIESKMWDEMTVTFNCYSNNSYKSCDYHLYTSDSLREWREKISYEHTIKDIHGQPEVLTGSCEGVHLL